MNGLWCLFMISYIRYVPYLTISTLFTFKYLHESLQSDFEAHSFWCVRLVQNMISVLPCVCAVWTAATPKNVPFFVVGVEFVLDFILLVTSCGVGNHMRLKLNQTFYICFFCANLDHHAWVSICMIILTVWFHRSSIY